MNALTNIPEQYRIEEMLGQRAMSRSYRVTDLQTGSTLALKTARYPDWFSDAERKSQCARLAEGLRSAERGQHPACVNAFSVTETEKGVLMTRPWVDGQPLVQVLRKRRSLPPADISFIAQQCAGALDSWASTGAGHGALTPQNVILCDDGSVRVTDARFTAGIGSFSLAGARCGIQESHAGTDIAALADILLSAIGEAEFSRSGNPVIAKMITVLRRAARHGRAFATATSLAEALHSLSNAEIVRHVWRPATATGLMAAFGTVCVLAMSEERPDARHAVTNHQPRAVSAVRGDAAGATRLVTRQEPARRAISVTSPDDDGWLSVLVRRQGVAALTRPAVVAEFGLDAAQSTAIDGLLQHQRNQLADMIERAAAAKCDGAARHAVVMTQTVRETTTENVLAVLTPAQRQLWRTLAGHAPAAGEPVL